MRFDWQAIAVALIIAAATLYVAQRGLARLRSFRPSAKSAPACGGCAKEESTITKRPATVLVQIASHKTTPQRRGR